MLFHLGSAAKKKKNPQLINDSWRTGTVPQIWEEAIVVPVHKKGKDKTKAESYHLISLTSCMGKFIERLVNSRHTWHLETKGLINPEQAVFRQDRSNEDQITELTQEREGALKEKKYTLVVRVDMEKVF